MKEPGTHKLTEALEGQIPAPTPDPEGVQNPAQGPGGQTQADVAEQTRLAQESRPDGLEDRDARLIRVGRAQQTHG